MNGLIEIEYLEIGKILKNCACIYACVKKSTGSTKEYHQKDFDKWLTILKEAIQMAEVGMVNNEVVPVYSKKLLATLIKKYFPKEVSEHVAFYSSSACVKNFIAALNGD